MTVAHDVKVSVSCNCRQARMSHRLIPRALSCMDPQSSSNMDGKRKLDALVTVDSDDESIPDLRSETSSNIDPGDVSPGDADEQDLWYDEFWEDLGNASVVAQRGSEVDNDEFFDVDGDDGAAPPQPPADPSLRSMPEVDHCPPPQVVAQRGSEVDNDEIFDVEYNDVMFVDHRPPPQPPAKCRRLTGKQPWNPPPPPQISSARPGGVAGLYGVSDAVFRRLKRSGAPLQLFQVLYFVASTMVVSQDVDMVDYYAGVGRLSKSFRSAGCRALRFERDDGGPDQDALSAHGLLTMIVYALRCINGQAMTHWGTVCSSWVWICRASSGRSEQNPLGFPNRPSNSQGNTMTARMAVCLWLLTCKQCTWVLEQPRSSLMEWHPYLQELKEVFGWNAINTYMGGFGAATQKPTKLKGNCLWLHTLKRSITAEDRARMGPSDTAIRLEPHPCGKKRCTGSKTLKATQEYPQGYADAVMAAYVQAQADRQMPMWEPTHADNGVRNWSQFLDMTPVYALMRMDPSFVPPGLD